MDGVVQTYEPIQGTLSNLWLKWKIGKYADERVQFNSAHNMQVSPGNRLLTEQHRQRN